MFGCKKTLSATRVWCRFLSRGHSDLHSTAGIQLKGSRLAHCLFLLGFGSGVPLDQKQDEDAARGCCAGPWSVELRPCMPPSPLPGRHLAPAACSWAAFCPPMLRPLSSVALLLTQWLSAHHVSCPAGRRVCIRALNRPSTFSVPLAELRGVAALWGVPRDVDPVYPVLHSEMFTVVLV